MVAQNPIALGANALRTLGEGGTQAVTQLANQLTRATSQLLSGVAGGPGGAGGFPLPLGLPPLPGLAAFANGNPNGNPNGNNNGAAAGPLAPFVQLLAPLAQLENSVLPAGVPRPTALLISGLGAGGPAPTPIPVETGIVRQAVSRPGEAEGVEGLNGVRPSTRVDVGIQLV